MGRRRGGNDRRGGHARGSDVELAKTRRARCTRPLSREWPVNAADRGFFQLSPDGTYVALVEGTRLWVRPLDSFEARALEGTEGASYPFWSPDGSWIGFFANTQLLATLCFGELVCG